ncbi:MAG: ribokinase [Oscillospiraceae bacterium]|jgi:ribokinase|nr:ribokinase [Oscillospiraceae bacterium]
MKKILVVGSLNMDISVQVDEMPCAGETVLSKGHAFLPGGKGANQAFACAALGAPVMMLGCVGRDDYGDALIKSLTGAGVDCSLIARRADTATGMALITVNEKGENAITVIQGANGVVDKQYIDDNMDALTACDIVVVQLEIPMDTVIYTIQKAKALNKTVIVDPAPAPDYFPDILYGLIDILKPNEHELAKLAGIAQGDIRGGLRALQKKGAGAIIVTLGADGALICTEDGMCETIAGIETEVVDTTAAGDTFTAALAVMLSEGGTMREAVRFANKAASMAVTRRGAQPSIPTRSELRAAFPEI